MVETTLYLIRSLVATLKLQPTLDDSLETKAVKFLESVYEVDEESADAFLGNFGETSDDPPTDFVHSIVVLLSSTSQAITTATMKMLKNVVHNCSAEVLLPLVQANLIPQLIRTLNPQSLSFAEAFKIHLSLLEIIATSLWLSTQVGLAHLEIKDDDEQQDVHETVLQQVVAPSEKYICHLCVNRYSIIERLQSYSFLVLLTQLLGISPYYQPTIQFVVNMPVFLTISSCLTFFESDCSIWCFLLEMNNAQREWNKKGGEVRQMWKTVLRMLRMEGFEDSMEEKLQNDKNGYYGRGIVYYSIQWNNQLGMNLP
ncbi:hypothetical protein BLNAU_9365 [Blattamonas nauphoetae]|uniref:Uncharacterized protein n=1 Tax=Blattamonas nauphoetae TaxID=2049346 RepID=A0ABQ9XW21_9EUKA|nr:hypothetical protein BLNAU_9365 [Blattamonas nauphoetae]